MVKVVLSEVVGVGIVEVLVISRFAWAVEFVHLATNAMRRENRKRKEMELEKGSKFAISTHKL